MDEERKIMKDENKNTVFCNGCDRPVRDDSEAICSMGGMACSADCREEHPNCDMAYCRNCIAADMNYLSTLK